MSDQHVHAAWQARLRAAPVAPALTLTAEGLVLGAGTVLVAATAPRRLAACKAKRRAFWRFLPQLTANPIAPSVLGNIERAAKAWREGDNCLAHIHLAHAGLHALRDGWRRLIGCSWPTAHCVQAHLRAMSSKRFISTSAPSTRSRNTAPISRAFRKGAAGRAANGPTARKPAAAPIPGGARPERAPPGHPYSAECRSRRRAFWASSARRRWPSLGRMPRAFSVRQALPRRHSGCCSSRLPTMFTLKVMCRRFQGCDTRGIATKRSFI